MATFGLCLGKLFHSDSWSHRHVWFIVDSALSCFSLFLSFRLQMLCPVSGRCCEIVDDSSPFGSSDFGRPCRFSSFLLRVSGVSFPSFLLRVFMCTTFLPRSESEDPPLERQVWLGCWMTAKTDQSSPSLLLPVNRCDSSVSWYVPF